MIRGYKNKYFYWEFIKIVFRTTINFIFQLFVLETNIRDFFIATIIAGFCLLTNYIQPYSEKYKKYNKLDISLNAILFINSYISIIINLMKNRHKSL